MSKNGDDGKKPWLDHRRDLSDRVKEWLGSEGFPLEFRTHEAMKAAGFQVAIGHHVPGKEPGSALEIDSLAYLGGANGSFQLVVECKMAPAPQVWVVFANSRVSAQLDGFAMSPVADVLVHQQRLRPVDADRGKGK